MRTSLAAAGSNPARSNAGLTDFPRGGGVEPYEAHAKYRVVSDSRERPATRSGDEGQPNRLILVGASNRGKAGSNPARSNAK